MIAASGTLFLSKTRPLATTAADGTFALTLLAFDRVWAHQVEPWRITYSGLDARRFWSAHEHDLLPGQPLSVELERVRVFATPRAPELQAQVHSIALAPLAHQGAANRINTSHQEQHTQ